MEADSEPLPDRCVPCEGGIAQIERDAALAHMKDVPGWELDHPRLRRRFAFRNFVEALAFVNAVGELAEDQQHHPDVHLTNYRNVELVIWTHAINGLSINDFVLARALGAIAPA